MRLPWICKGNPLEQGFQAPKGFPLWTQGCLIYDEGLLTVMWITFCVLNIFWIGLNVVKSMVFLHKTVEGLLRIRAELFGNRK